MLRLYRYKCGCVGTKREEGKPTLTLFHTDSASHEGFCIMLQYVDHDPIVELSEEEVRKIIGELDKIVGDGYKFRQIRDWLGAEKKDGQRPGGLISSA